MIRKVAVIMGSDSDWPVVKGACAQLKALDIPFEAHILSAHRTPAEAAEFAKNARANGFGVPVATVALNGAKNAAWLAAEILALGDEALAAKLDAERVAMARQIAAKEEKLQKEIEEL